MAFGIGSIANNPLQLQMQQMLGNLATAQLNSMASTSQAQAVKTPQQLNPQSTIVPMDLENSAEGVESSEKKTEDPSKNVNLNLISASPEMMFGNLMGMASIMPSPATAFPMLMPTGLDPTLLNLQMMQQMNQRMKEQQQTQPQPSTSASSKEMIQCKSCTLYPPTAGPKPTTREKPPGCRTVFVGGLPDNMTESIIHEIFERCGEITTLRLSKKNFCHIRFAFEASIESAIYLSGYRVKIANSSESANCGRLHVDYAQARDDQYEYECKQRQLQREARHREKIEKDRLRPLSPPAAVHFSEIEATNLSEKIKNDDTFMKSCQVLITWLERGDCNKKNSNTIYTIIQSTNSQVRRLLNERSTYEQDLKDAKEKFRRQMYTINTQLNQIEKLFNAASHQKVWDHFTKAQRKNIDAWKKSLDVRPDRHEEDIMEISDEEYSFSNKRARYDNDRLKEENDSLRCQLRATKNEIEHLKSEGTIDPDTRDKQTKVLHETIRNLQTHLLSNRQRESELQSRIQALEGQLKKANVKELLLKTKIAGANAKGSRDSVSTKGSDTEDSSEKPTESQSEKAEYERPEKQVPTEDESDEDCVEVIEPEAPEPETIDCDDDVRVVPDLGSEIEARLVSLSTAFLLIQPRGVSLSLLSTYAKQFSTSVDVEKTAEVLKKHPGLFQEANGRWRFVGFESDCEEVEQNGNGAEEEALN